MPALDRALAFEQRHAAVVRVGEDLNLDVPRPFDQPFDVEGAVAERVLGVSPGRLHRLQRVVIRADDAHADAAAAARRLHQRRAADPLERGEQRLVGLIGGRLSRHDGHTGGLHQPSRADLRAHRDHRRRRRADEDDAGVRARLGKCRVLGEEPVPG